jgi:hypothetical protein
MMPDDGETDGTWPQLLKALDGFKDCGAKPFRTSGRRSRREDDFNRV